MIERPCNNEAEGMRRLSCAVILDALQDYRCSAPGIRRDRAKSFLLVRSGDLRGWLDYLDSVDTDHILSAIGRIVIENEENPPETQKPRMLKAGKSYISLSQASRMNGVNYMKLYRIYNRNPGIDYKQLCVLAAAKKKQEKSTCKS